MIITIRVGCAILAVIELFLLSVTGCSRPIQVPASPLAVEKVAKEEPAEATLLRILASPEKYHKRSVSVRGYLHVKFEDQAVYFSKDDADHLNSENALWIELSKDCKLESWRSHIRNSENSPEPKYFDGRSVTINGDFDKTRSGHLGAFAGTLTKITRIQEIPRFYDGAKLSGA